MTNQNQLVKQDDKNAIYTTTNKVENNTKNVFIIKEVPTYVNINLSKIFKGLKKFFKNLTPKETIPACYVQVPTARVNLTKLIDDAFVVKISDSQAKELIKIVESNNQGVLRFDINRFRHVHVVFHIRGTLKYFFLLKDSLESTYNSLLVGITGYKDYDIYHCPVWEKCSVDSAYYFNGQLPEEISPDHTIQSIIQVVK